MGDPLKIIFMGTPDFAATALCAILGSSHQVIAVYTQPPRPKGRGQQLTQSPVHALALAHHIPVFTPESLRKSPEAQAEFAALEADIAVVAAYGLLLPQAVLDAPKYGCLNIHGSLLPRWRGASPIQHAIWQGDTETGVTIMQMDAGLDTGPTIKTGTVPIGPETTSPMMYDQLATLGGAMVIDVLNDIVRDDLVASVPQVNTGATNAPLLKKEDGRIDWQKTAAEIDCQVRGLQPWPGTYCTLADGTVLKILSVRLHDDQGGALPGTILDRALGLVACGGGTCLRILELQSPSGKKMDMAAFINGGTVSVGTVLS